MLYQPTSRRPIAGMFRRTANVAVRLCVRWRIHPDVISYASVVVSAMAAVCFWRSRQYPWLLVAGPLLCYVRLWCNMLDGMVALASGTASSRGEVLNDLPDRVSDVLIFAGVAHSGLCSPFAAYWAAIFALMTAYVGTLGQAVAGRREFGGVMSKPWRMVVLHVGAWVALGMMWAGRTLAMPTPIDWACFVIILGCLQTVVVRLKRTFGLLSENAQR